MARGPRTPPPAKQQAVLRIPRAEARAKLEKQIERGRRLVTPSANALAPAASEADYKRWNDYNAELLKRIFSADDFFGEYDFAIYGAPVSPGGPTPWQLVVPSRITCLESIIDRLDLIEAPEESDAAQAETRQDAAIDSRKVFVVHGRDEIAKQTVARFLTAIELTPIILHEQPSQGMTLIEKFEAHSDVGFAVVLVTPDDRGGLAEDATKSPPVLEPRARENVVFELGYFRGKLGKARVAALVRGNVKFPSDYIGVVWIQMDDAGGWKNEFARELAAAQMQFNRSKVFRA